MKVNKYGYSPDLKDLEQSPLWNGTSRQMNKRQMCQKKKKNVPLAANTTVATKNARTPHSTFIVNKSSDLPEKNRTTNHVAIDHYPLKKGIEEINESNLRKILA